MKNIIFKYGLSAFFWCMLALHVAAQPIDPPMEDDPMDPTPIDSWIFALVIIAAVLTFYAGKKKRCIC